MEPVGKLAPTLVRTVAVLNKLLAKLGFLLAALMARIYSGGLFSGDRVACLLREYEVS